MKTLSGRILGAMFLWLLLISHAQAGIVSTPVANGTGVQGQQAGQQACPVAPIYWLDPDYRCTQGPAQGTYPGYRNLIRSYVTGPVQQDGEQNCVTVIVDACTGLETPLESQVGGSAPVYPTTPSYSQDLQGVGAAIYDTRKDLDPRSPDNHFTDVWCVTSYSSPSFNPSVEAEVLIQSGGKSPALQAQLLFTRSAPRPAYPLAFDLRKTPFFNTNRKSLPGSLSFSSEGFELLIDPKGTDSYDPFAWPGKLQATVDGKTVQLDLSCRVAVRP
jgi:hypothetical protein